MVSRWRRPLAAVVALAVAGTLAGPGSAGAVGKFILAMTTSVDNSGLADHLLDHFEATSGELPRVIIQATRAVLKYGERGDIDAVLVHHRDAEDAFIAAGHGIMRRDVMESRFLIVGPASDPAAISGLDDIAAAMARIAEAGATFVSRGDDSGTHAAERQLWAVSGIDPHARLGRWYRETDSGMGATLNVATAMEAYTLSESGSWFAYANRPGLKLLVDADPPLRNRYGIILVNPARHPRVAHAAAKRFVDWLTGPAGQTAIAAFTIDGQRPFNPVDDIGDDAGAR